MSVARPLSLEEEPKRSPGKIGANDNWLVLTESKNTGTEDKPSYQHSCGTRIAAKGLNLTVRDGVFDLSGGGDTQHGVVPYCPKCEEEPKGGYVTPKGGVVIY